MTNRPFKLCDLTDEQMRSSTDTVTCGELGVNRAVMQCGVLRTTLKDRLSGRVKPGTKPSPVAYLEPKEEEHLVKFLFECARIGYGNTKREVMYIVEQAAR